jgi:hypothetical protein
MAELEADIRYRYDLEGFTARHPQANIFRLINDAYRDLRDRLTSDGSLLFVTTAQAAESSTGVTTGYPGTLLANPALGEFTTVLEVHCQIGTSWVPLRHRHLMDALTDTDDSATGTPQCWSLVGLSTETGGVTGLLTGSEMRILITPPIDTAGRYFRVVGVRRWDDLTLANDRLMTDFGLGEYVVAKVGLVVGGRDDDVNIYAARRLEVETIYQDLKKRSKRRDPSPARRVDVRSRGRLFR